MRRLARGPVVILLLTVAFFAFAGIYIGWFGTQWGLLLLVPVVGLALACGLLWSRTLRGEKALEAGASYLTLDTTGATGAGAPQIPWSGIDRSTTGSSSPGGIWPGPATPFCWTGRTSPDRRSSQPRIATSLPGSRR